MTSPLDNLCGPRKELAHEAPDEQEYAHLIEDGLRRLTDSKNPDLYFGSRFDLAYNASFSLSLAALRRLGYRPVDNKRYIVFQALTHTLKLGPEVWRILNKCHDIRNDNVYRGASDIDERLVEGLINACQKVADKISELTPQHTHEHVGAPLESDDNTGGGTPKL